MKNFSSCQLLIVVLFVMAISSALNAQNADREFIQNVATLENISKEVPFSIIQDQEFKATEDNLINLGFSSNADWLKLNLENTTNKTQHRILRIAKPLQDSITFYEEHGDKFNISYSGVMVKEDDKMLKGSSIYFPFTLEPGQQKIAYIKAVSKYGKSFSISTETQDSYFQKERTELIIVSILFGALITIGLYNIFLGIGLNDITYILYGLACFGSLITQLTVRAVPKQFFTYDAIFFLEWWPPLVIAISVVPVIIFCIKFLNTKKYSKSADVALKSLLILEPLFFVYEIVRAEIFGIYTTNSLVASGIMILAFFALYAGISCYRNGNKAALYFIYAWAAFCIGMIIYVGTLFAIIPINYFTSNIYLLGSVMEVSLLSFALASRYKLLEIEKLALDISLRDKQKELKSSKEEVISLMTESIEHLRTKAELAENLKKLSREEGVNLKSILADLKSSELEDSKLLLIRKNIADINFEFIKRIKEKHPKLSKTELEICSFILIGLSRKEIANLRNTTLHAVKASRSRLKKKLDLTANDSLDHYIKNIAEETKRV